MEHREDELFIHFEKAGGVRWIYDEIGESLLFMGQELQVPEKMPLKTTAIITAALLLFSSIVLLSSLNLAILLWSIRTGLATFQRTLFYTIMNGWMVQAIRFI